MTKQTEAQKKAQQKFRESRATIQLVMTPDEREAIKATAADLGVSANAYIMDMVRKDIERRKKANK
jgi:predicted DNA binding CopG/RHH family protein